MRWSDIQWNPSSRVLRQFAATWLLFWGVLAAHQWLVRENPGLGAALAAISLVPGGMGLIWPPAVRWLFLSFTVLAFPLGWLVSQIVLLILFYGIITPVALAFKAWRRDRLHRAASPEQQSYWKPKSLPADMRRYLRQF